MPDAARQCRFHQLAVVSIVLPLAITVTIAIAMEKAAAMTILQPTVNFNCLQDLLELHQKQNLELRCFLLSSKASSGASTRLDRCLNPRLGQVGLPGVHLPPLGLCLVSHDLPRLRIGQWSLAAFPSLSHNGVVEVHQGSTIPLWRTRAKEYGPTDILAAWVMLRLDTRGEVSRSSHLLITSLL